MDLKCLITHFTYRIEPKPGGGFIAHATDPAAPPLEAATREELHFMPELSQALAAQGNSSDIKIFVNRKTSFATKTSSGQLNLGAEESVPEVAWSRSDTVQLDDAKPTDQKITNAIYGRSGEIVGNSPITPETSGSWALLRFLMTILIVALLMYFFLHRH